ncbi:GNAT family N-acetyltransferase [Polymorphospora sp. NPDC050346]|uniref:GNAT family N-acetyltransferase n=1 Tax=Polymorphospora sp. NPDC050346 TaxID=3155780 RepID=UPI0033ECF073
MSVSLRVAEAVDVPRIAELHRRSRIDAYADLVSYDTLTRVPAPVFADWWVERWSYERETHVLTVAERDGRLVGFTYVGPDDEGSQADTGLLYAIHLESAERGRGTGRALMAEALATLREQGWQRAALWVLAGNDRARGFYERGGWQPTGWCRDSTFGPPVKEIRYDRPLR